MCWFYIQFRVSILSFTLMEINRFSKIHFIQWEAHSLCTIKITYSKQDQVLYQWTSEWYITISTVCVFGQTFPWKWTQQMMNQPHDCVHHCELQRWHLRHDRKCEALSVFHAYTRTHTHTQTHMSTHTYAHAMNNYDVHSCQPYLMPGHTLACSWRKLDHLEWIRTALSSVFFHINLFCFGDAHQ